MSFTRLLDDHPPGRLPAGAVSPPRTSTFMIVDDHPVVSFALRHLLQSQAGWSVVEHAPTPEAAMAVIDRAKEGAAVANGERTAIVDCVVVDLLFPAQCGMDFLRWLRANHNSVVPIVYSVQPEDVYARRCLQAGARGYVSKDSSVDTLLSTVRLALEGHIAVSGRILTEGISGFLTSRVGSRLDSLSVRELEVLQLIGLGYGNQKIAQVLCRSAKTIESHRYRISRKLGIPNGPELMHLALQHRQAAEGLPGGILNDRIQKTAAITTERDLA